MLLLVAGLVNGACHSLSYINDEESVDRQKELHRKRLGNTARNIALSIGSMVGALFTGVYVSFIPSERNMKRVALINQGTDTMQVNMLSGETGEAENYCDFLNIRIPPQKTCRLLVPESTMYNLYFREVNDTSDVDEVLELDVSEISKIRLAPGMTVPSGTDTLQTIKP